MGIWEDSHWPEMILDGSKDHWVDSKRGNEGYREIKEKPDRQIRESGPQILDERGRKCWKNFYCPGYLRPLAWASHDDENDGGDDDDIYTRKYPLGKFSVVRAGNFLGFTNGE